MTQVPDSAEFVIPEAPNDSKLVGFPPLADDIFQKPQFIPNQSGQQEFCANLGLAGAPEGFCDLRIFKKQIHFSGAIFRTLYQIVLVSCGKLHRDAARVTGDYRPSLPKCFRDDQTEAFSKGLLENHISTALENIDFHIPDPSHVRKNTEIRVLDRFRIDLVEYFPAFRIVPCHCTYHR